MTQARDTSTSRSLLKDSWCTVEILGTSVRVHDSWRRWVHELASASVRKTCHAHLSYGCSTCTKKSEDRAAEIQDAYRHTWGTEYLVQDMRSPDSESLP